jgi:shikimate kinase
LGSIVLITGPIGAGKSTVAAMLAARLGAPVTDLDDLFFADVGAGWLAARAQQADQVEAWLAAGEPVVVVHGPFATGAERAALDALGRNTTLVLLDVPFDVALERVTDDPGRGASRLPDFLRGTHDAFAQLRPAIPADLAYDTTVMTPEAIVDDLVSRLRASDGTGRGPRS